MRKNNYMETPIIGHEERHHIFWLIDALAIFVGYTGDIEVSDGLFKFTCSNKPRLRNTDKERITRFIDRLNKRKLDSQKV